MDVRNFKECEDVKIDKFPFKGGMRDVAGTSVRWLSSHGDDGTGYPEYGLRLFTIQPGGEIPIHNHFYHQTMYILSGEVECWQFDMETEEIVESKIEHYQEETLTHYRIAILILSAMTAISILVIILLVFSS